MNEVTVKKGRPSKYSKTLCREVLTLLSQGIGIKHATTQCGITYPSWRAWMDKDDKLRDESYVWSGSFSVKDTERYKLEMDKYSV